MALLRRANDLKGNNRFIRFQYSLILKLAYLTLAQYSHLCLTRPVVKGPSWWSYPTAAAPSRREIRFWEATAQADMRH
jgi:hypothetical protein